MINKIKKFITDPFGIDCIVRHITDHADQLQDSIRANYEKTIDLSMRLKRLDRLYEEYKFQILVSDAFEDCTPDMYWAKDIYGRYIIANKAIRDGLLFSNHPYGKTDVELAIAQKARIGDRNHTFGEVCGNSDETVLLHEKPLRFVEWGKVNGEMLILEVHKNIMRDNDGNVVGTVGIGRDITDAYTTLKRIADETKCEYTKKEIMVLLDKYTFENKDVHGGE